MNRITRTSLAAVLLSLALVACGGGSGGSTDTGTTTGGGGTNTIQGVNTPSSVSVVTAKNAQ